MMTSPLANLLLWGAASHALAILCVSLTLGIIGLLREDDRLGDAAGSVALWTLVTMLAVTAIVVAGKLLGVW